MDRQSNARCASKILCHAGILAFLVAGLGFELRAEDGKYGDKAATPSKNSATEPSKNSATEPFAPAFSMTKAAAFLDSVAVTWTRERECGTCHTNYPYLVARPVLKDSTSPALAEVRQFFEKRVAHWDDPEKGAKPLWDAEVISTATALALNDAATTGELHPLTRKALDRTWTLQTPYGGFHWLKTALPPLEYDDYYGAVVAALGVGHAPGGYAQTPAAQAGVTRLRQYLAKTPAPNLHHQTVLLWASTRVDNLMPAETKRATIARLRELQRPDGGWNLPSMGNWKRRGGAPNDPNSPSDGYATGLIVFVLRQTGIPASDPALERGAAWLRTNQRASGRWFTRSLVADREHYISHAGTAYAILALHACGAGTGDLAPRTGALPSARPSSSTTTRAAGLSQ